MIQSRISNLRGESEKYRLGFRVILALVVFGSMIWGATANLSDQVMAPLFAIIAATGLAGTLGASAIGMREKILKGVVQLMAILASCFSATLWLLSAGAGPWIQWWGVGLVVFAVVGLWVNAGDMDAAIAKQGRCDGGATQE